MVKRAHNQIDITRTALSYKKFSKIDLHILARRGREGDVSLLVRLRGLVKERERERAMAFKKLKTGGAFRL